MLIKLLLQYCLLCFATFCNVAVINNNCNAMKLSKAEKQIYCILKVLFCDILKCNILKYCEAKRTEVVKRRKFRRKFQRKYRTKFWNDRNRNVSEEIFRKEFRTNTMGKF